MAAGAHQIHGAVGFTREQDLRLFTQRLLAWRSELGNDGHWAARLGRSVAARGPAAFWPTSRPAAMRAESHAACRAIAFGQGLGIAAAEQWRAVPEGGCTQRSRRQRMSPRHYFAIGTLAGITIFCEIALTRLFSVVQYYHGAFLAISVALFGFAVSGVFVMLRPERSAASASMRRSPATACCSPPRSR